MTKDEIRELTKNQKWGYLRETDEIAISAGQDKDTGLIRTGLPTYLKAIYPAINDWIHDKIISNSGRKTRPDYRSESLKLIVEFDGLPHYQQPYKIKQDKEKTELYIGLGYKVVRIPYFIQLSKLVVKTLFDVDMKEELFDERIPSMGIKGRNTPAFICGAGVKRMAKEFHMFPEQYKVNVEFLELQNDDELTGVESLKTLYESMNK